MTRHVRRAALSAVAVLAFAAGLSGPTRPVEAGPPLGGSPGTTAPRAGSWGHYVKDEMTWDADDIRSTVDALLGTGQDFCMYPISTEAQWDQFGRLLKAVEGTDLKIFAVMPAPNVTHVGSRWFGDDGPPAHDFTGYGEARWECERAYIEAWIDAWESAARACSLEADAHSNLYGLVINDFHVHVESVDYPSCVFGELLTLEDVERIHAAAHRYDEDFGFYPATHFSSVGRFIAEDGFVLGGNYGVKFHNGERMAVTLRFDMPSLFLMPHFTFFHYDSIGSSALQKSVLVNGIDIGVVADTGQDFVQYFETVIQSELQEGENTIEFVLESTALTNGCGGTGDFWQVWDVGLRYADGTGWHEASFEAEYAVDPSESPYNVSCPGRAVGDGSGIVNTEERGWGGCGGLPDGPAEGYARTRIIAAPTGPYAIGSAIDGLVPYHSSTDSNGQWDALDPHGFYRDLLVSTDRILGSDMLIATQAALSDNMDLDPETVEDRVAIALDVADAACIYLFPLGLYYMDEADQRGIFAESTPDGAPTDTQFMAQWPGRQSAVRGWYQRWVAEPSLDGVELLVEVWDSRDASDLTGNLVKSIYLDSSGGVLLEVDAYADDQDSDFVPGSGDPPLVVDAADPLVLSFERLIDQAGVKVTIRTYFRVFDDADGDGDLDDPVDAVEFTFESGTTYAEVIEVYELLSAMFLGLP